MEVVEDRPPPSEPSSTSGELRPMAETPAENAELINQPNNQSSSEASINKVNNNNNIMDLSTSSETKESQTRSMEPITEPPQTKVTDVPLDNSASTPNITVHVAEESNQGAMSADSEPGSLEDISNRQQHGDSTVGASSNVDPSTFSSEEKESQNDHKDLKIDPSQSKDNDVAVGAVGSPSGNVVDNQINLLDSSSSENIELKNDKKELTVQLPQANNVDVSEGDVDSPAVNDDNQSKLSASSSEKMELQNDQKELKKDSSQTNISDAAEKKSHIDTTAPFESVKHAVSKFGGIVDWKAHRVQTVERRKHVEHELEKAQQDIPECRKKSESAEEAKVKVLQELDSTKRLIEELKLNLERLQTEERQARQDSELAKLRVEEMEQGIADDSSVAAKAQLEVAKARYTSAITELKSVNEELEGLQGEYASLVVEKAEAVERAEEVVASSKQVEKTVEDLTIELIATKEALETAHASHMEAEEHRMGTIMARDQDALNWEKELKQAEDEIQSLSQKILSAKDLKSKLNTASTLLIDLKAELNAYTEESMPNHEGDEDEEGVSQQKPEKKTQNEIQKAVESAKKELEEVKLKIENATTEVNYLKVAAASLKSELQKEKSSYASVRRREGMASVTASSLEAELDNTRTKVALVQMMEKEGTEKIAKLPKKVKEAFEEANEANLLAQAAREELQRMKEEAEQAKAAANTMQRKLLAAQKEIEAARASERFAKEATKALQESGSYRNKTELDTSSCVKLSAEEYYDLSKQAYDAEELAKTRVAAANSEIEIAKESELKTLEKLNDVNREMSARRESLRVAMEKAEKAREGKLGVEHELRKWRSEHDQRRKAGESGHGGVGKQGSKNATRSASIPARYFSSLKSLSHSNSGSSPDGKKKKKKSFFPWVLMFFGKKKAHPTH